jgi:hypothetical protein
MNKFFFILVVAAVVATNMISLPAMAEDTQVVDSVARGLISALDERVVKLNATVAQYNGIYTAAANKAVKAAADEMAFIKKVKSDLDALKKDAITMANLEKSLSAKGYLSAKEIAGIVDPSKEPTTEVGKAIKNNVKALARQESLTLLEEASKVDLGHTKDAKADAVAARKAIDAINQPIRDDVTKLDGQINGVGDNKANAIVTKVATAEANALAAKNETDKNWKTIWKYLWNIGIVFGILLLVLGFFIFKKK